MISNQYIQLLVYEYRPNNEMSRSEIYLYLFNKQMEKSKWKCRD